MNKGRRHAWHVYTSNEYVELERFWNANAYNIIKCVKEEGISVQHKKFLLLTRQTRKYTDHGETIQLQAELNKID